ncbi:hypothetical protein ACHAWO_009490 [Cyclotella atomus]|uniref:Uncharacterized protein n=1 Tax=Cyclotella atomus TaxID=382360 RepID=A0ABD3N204_9STRA
MKLRAPINTPHRVKVSQQKTFRLSLLMFLLVMCLNLRRLKETSWIGKRAFKMKRHHILKICSPAVNAIFSVPSNVNEIPCKSNNEIPNDWCVDAGGNPRYLGCKLQDGLESTNILRYNHQGFEQCLANKTIVFIGDSRVRYQIMNLLGYLQTSRFMKCQDYESFDSTDSTSASPDSDCYLIEREFQLKDTKGDDWTSYYKESNKMIGSDSANGKQHSLCDCYREEPFSELTTYENRFIKRQTPHGEINIVYLQNFVNLIRMNQDYPPFSSFWSQNHCNPGECSIKNRVDAFTGNLNSTLWQILPLLNATHAFVSAGWNETETVDSSCIIKAFQESHSDMQIHLISHPSKKNDNSIAGFDGDRLECSINALDRQTMSEDVPEDWFRDDAHVLSILNEEFNHRLIDLICPITR